MTIENFQSGWIPDPGRVQDVIDERIARGEAVYASSYAAANPHEQLPGTWARMKAAGTKGVFLRDREMKLYGKYRRPAFQNRGTCVSRAMWRGVNCSTDVAIADKFALLQPVTLSFAPIYTLARHECGHDRCGRGDGAIMADAATAVNRFGVAISDVLFKGLEEPEIERLAVQYAAPGIGTPQAWIDACKGHTCDTFAIDSLELLFDCIAAGFPVPYAHQYITGLPNPAGLSDLGSFGPHARCFVGCYVDESGEDQLESSESWGRFPAGQPDASDRTIDTDRMPRIQIRYAGGLKTLAPGDVGVKARRWWEQIQGGKGEAWAVGPAKFPAASITAISEARKVLTV